MICRHRLSWRLRSSSSSERTEPPSSAHRGTGQRKWWASTVCVTSCGSTLSRRRLYEPSIFISCWTWLPMKLNDVAPPAPAVVMTTFKGQGCGQRGISAPSHSTAFCLR
jgi:hypothetical protein